MCVRLSCLTLLENCLSHIVIFMKQVSKASPEDLPPFGKSWERLYLSLLVYLLVLIGLFYVFMQSFS